MTAKSDVYYSDYPNEPIGGGNPYYCCSYCHISDPQINGRLEGHSSTCEYRLRKEQELQNKEIFVVFQTFTDDQTYWHNQYVDSFETEEEALACVLDLQEREPEYPAIWEKKPLKKKYFSPLER